MVEVNYQRTGAAPELIRSEILKEGTNAMATDDNSQLPAPSTATFNQQREIISTRVFLKSYNLLCRRSYLIPLIWAHATTNTTQRSPKSAVKICLESGPRQKTDGFGRTSPLVNLAKFDISMNLFDIFKIQMPRERHYPSEDSYHFLTSKTQV